MEGSGIGQFIPLILIFVIFYFFLIGPQQKKVKEHKAMVESLKKGDKVVTSGGITGTISRVIDNDKVEVEIADNVTVEVIRGTATENLAAFITAADASLTNTSDDIYAQYNFTGGGNTLIVIDENKSGTVNAGDTLIILTGLSTADGLDASDFI